ncbi:MAG: hypothetical protein HKO64_09700 [Xanthomonadales bacterium]|nr:hypothetical protein [Xanthomonadales bacterium]
MNWVRAVENRRFLIVGGILLIVAGSLVVTALRNPVSFDAFWHLQTGRDWLVNGLSPWLDQYSYTFYQQEISNPPVIFQALLYGFTSEFGVRNGFLLFKLSCFLLTIGAAFAALRQLKAHPLIYAFVLPLIAFSLQLRSTVRPELLAYLFTILALMMYFRAGEKVNLRNVLPMVLLALLWTIYHRSSIIAFVIFAGFFLDCAITQVQTRASAAEWTRWFALGALTLAVGFLNPGLSHPLLEAISFSSEWNLYIAEYQYGPWLFEYPATFVFLMLAILTPVMAIQQRKPGYLLCCLTLTYAAFESARLFSFAGMVVTLIFAKLLISSGFPAHWKSPRFRFLPLAGVLSIVLVIPALASNVMRAQALMAENRQTINRFPQALTDYMRDSQLSGRVHNEFSTGGFLIYQLASQNRFYIDGRTHILYPVDHLKRFMETVALPEVLRKELDKYDVDMVAWIYDSTRHDTVMSLGDFSLDFVDSNHALYVRGPANFALLGSLSWQPACWHESLSEQLQIERRKMDSVLPWNSGLYPFANFVLGFDQAEDKLAFLDQSFARDVWNDDMRRFAGFQLMQAGHYELAASMFAGVITQRPQDLLASATAFLDADNHDAASRALMVFIATPWPVINSADLQVLQWLYQRLNKIRKLNAEEQRVLEKIGGSLDSPTLRADEKPSALGVFCLDRASSDPRPQ